jgi:hypothetical protein
MKRTAAGTLTAPAAAPEAGEPDPKFSKIGQASNPSGSLR